MTTEDDFQRALDANPEDFQTRLVFADWLQERGDERAEGYRALGIGRRVPWYTDAGKRWIWWNAGRYQDHFKQHVLLGSPQEVHYPARLPSDWFVVCFGDGNFARTTSRREAEDAAALAFARLPESRRAELLAQPVLT